MDRQHLPQRIICFKLEKKNKTKYLSKEQAIAFHHVMAQLLFLTTQSRRDIGVAVSFPTSRVRQPDEDEWGKLERVLEYLYGTRRLKLPIQVN